MSKRPPRLFNDFADLLLALTQKKCRFVVIGAHAMAAWGYVRATGDLDVLIDPSPENAERVYAALTKFGAPLRSVTPRDFATLGTVYQIGLPPLRIDILNRIDGVETKLAYSRAKRTKVAGVSVRVLSLDHLVKNKLRTGRAKDVIDANELRKIQKRKPKKRSE